MATNRLDHVHIIAVISPAKGKGDRLKELLAEICATVHKNEDYTLRYMATERIDDDSGEDPEIVMIETYKNEESAKKHTTTEYFNNIFAALEKESLLRKAPYLAKTKTKSGFDVDRIPIA